MAMKENDLNEVAPFPVAELAFLSNRPYYFKLKKLTETTTAVDWNRNGIFGENHVRADVNDGYSAAYRDTIVLPRAAGAASLASRGKSLAVVYPAFGQPIDYDKYELAMPSIAKPSALHAVVITDHKQSAPQTIVAKDVTGDPSTLFVKNRLWLAYPSSRGYIVRSFTSRLNGLEEVTVNQFGKPGLVPTLVDSPSAPLILVWNSVAKTVSVTGVNGDTPFQLGEIVSNHAVGGV